MDGERWKKGKGREVRERRVGSAKEGKNDFSSRKRSKVEKHNCYKGKT